MARRGAFGRLPRAAPDLTNTIVALIRESMAQEDSNMVDAWKNGGKVAGKGVDDDRLLAHMKKRRDGLDPGDPLWDEWNSNYMQYDFAIHESKMALKNDQGKVSDAEMAKFYAKWASREDVQKDSEFYRSLLSRSAKWNEAAKQRSAGRGASNKAEAHQRWADNVYKNEVLAAEHANNYLVVIARQYDAAPANADSLDDINPNSVGYGRFLDAIQDGKVDDPLTQGYIDAMNAEIKKTNPNWTYSQSNLEDLLDRGDHGLKRLIDGSTGKDERNGWTDRRARMRYEKTRLKTTETNERIQIAADNYAIDLDNCAGDPYCARNVTKKFHDKLVKESQQLTKEGGFNIETADPQTTNALGTTIRQTEDILSGKPIAPPPAALVGGQEAGMGNIPGYTIFDGAAGRETPTGWLGTAGNLINDGTKMLDNGGWVETKPMVGENGAVMYDGDGDPMYDYVIHGADIPRPQGAVAVPGVTMMTDTTRSTTGPAAGPQGVVPHAVTPVQYAVPVPANVIYTTGTGAPLDAQMAASVKAAGGAPALPPWEEIRGVKGPDGAVRTLYRTGDGVTKPYLYHDVPPVEQGVQPNKQGQFVIPVMALPDGSLTADMQPWVRGAESARSKNPKSGLYNQGTFQTPGAAGVSQALRKLYTTPPQHQAGSGDPKGQLTDYSKAADKLLSDYRRGYESLPLQVATGPNGVMVPNPERIAGLSDLGQLNVTVNLYKQGKVGSALDEAYGATQSRTPADQQRRDDLARRGFGSPGMGGAEEFERRLSLVENIESAEDRLLTRRQQMGGANIPGYSDTPIGKFAAKGGIWQSIAADEEAVRKAKGDVMNPTISVSNIKVPGMEPLMQPGSAAAFAGVGGSIGAFVPNTPFAAPKQPGFNAPPPAPLAKQPTPSAPVANTPPPPTTVKPPPPPPMPSPTTTPGYWQSEKGYTAPPKPSQPANPIRGPR